MINLKEVITKYPECLESSEKLKAYLTDLYPDEKAKISIIVAISNSGIAEEIKKLETVDEMTISRFCDKLENTYGFSQKLSYECLNLWSKVYGKKYNNYNVSTKLESKNMISAGREHSIALKIDGTVFATGLNNDGQCDVYNWQDILAVSAGARHSLGLKTDGTVVATGDNIGGCCDVSNWCDIIAISAGMNYSLGLKSNGTVVSIGRNNGGRCDTSKWNNIIAISANKHSLGLKEDGTIVAAGYNDRHQCDISNVKLYKKQEEY